MAERHPESWYSFLHRCEARICREEEQRPSCLSRVSCPLWISMRGGKYKGDLAMSKFSLGGTQELWPSKVSVDHEGLTAGEEIEPVCVVLRNTSSILLQVWIQEPFHTEDAPGNQPSRDPFRCTFRPNSILEMPPGPWRVPTQKTW